MRMVARIVVVCATCFACWIPQVAQAGTELCINGNFNTVTNGIKPFGWIYDLAWTKRTPWKNNPRYVTVIEKQGSKRGVLRLEMGDLGARDESVVMSNIIPFERNQKYKVSFDGRTEGPMERIYVRGYKWKSGIRPHANPKLSELQNVYRGKPFAPLKKSWKSYSRQFPYFAKGKSSKLNLKHLKHVRFIVLYMTIPIWETTPPGSIYIDNVKIQKK